MPGCDRVNDNSRAPTFAVTNDPPEGRRIASTAWTSAPLVRPKGTMAMPPGDPSDASRPWKISPLASAMALSSAKNSVWAGAMAVTIAMCGRTRRRCTAPVSERSSAANSASLALVFPTEPVTPITVPLMRARAARPRSFRAAKVSATRTCGWGVSADTIAPAAPCAKA
ncbi:hypothetical protein WR25_16446 [Diploscapter pachys]|uniref:Uncharacterized protein n=1 Tax=Diploscapter pachys TaxID=2018661 RepID=A0A2A2M3Y0_9BILA|nr:hypothetical protein WR25_16446 [Diploscapter pachys]